MDWIIALTVSVSAIIANIAFVSVMQRRAYARGVADEKKRTTLLRLGGKVEWHFRVASNNQSDSSAVIYAQAPDGSEYVCNEYLAGINAVNAGWISVTSGDIARDCDNITRRFMAWRALKRTGAR